MHAYQKFKKNDYAFPIFIPISQPLLFIWFLLTSHILSTLTKLYCDANNNFAKPTVSVNNSEAH